MRRRTNVFLVTIDEDMTGYGYNGGDRAPEDVAHTIKQAFLSNYHPQVAHLGRILREDNPSEDTTLHMDVTLIDLPEGDVIAANEEFTFRYAARHPRPDKSEEAHARATDYDNEAERYFEQFE